MSLNVNGNQQPKVVKSPASPASGTYTVKSGDTLSGIAKKLLGDGNRWGEIYEANKKTIGSNPNALKVGQRLTMPGAPQPVETAKPITPPDSVVISQPNYPTVGDYVKKEFSETMETVGNVMQGTAEVAFPPFLLGEIAAIKGKHQMNAMRQVWDLPMDPEGKWKDKARTIMDEEATLASKEIAELPAIKAAHIAAVAVKDGVVWTGQKIADGAVWAGKNIVKAGEAVVDGAVYTGVAIGKGVEWTGQKIQQGAIAAGDAVKDGAVAIKDGVVWTGKKIGEGAEAVADATVSGAKAVGNGVAWVGHEYVEANKTVARGFLSGLKAIGKWFTGAADNALPATAPTPYHKPFN